LLEERKIKPLDQGCHLTRNPILSMYFVKHIIFLWTVVTKDGPHVLNIEMLSTWANC